MYAFCLFKSKYWLSCTNITLTNTHATPWTTVNPGSTLASLLWRHNKHMPVIGYHCEITSNHTYHSHKMLEKS
ncbi:hypothetical protein I79_024919 [Cricetulus griseus]|uniref:Uncharacterized protein n=1 Tax=Cricetulus griseus TaxID=10029 RepID=G3ILZ2_CRIGR|nr:hypothetical protein I79_024919 [Cricetulus griseus]